MKSGWDIARLATALHHCPQGVHMSEPCATLGIWPPDPLFPRTYYY